MTNSIVVKGVRFRTMACGVLLVILGQLTCSSMAHASDTLTFSTNGNVVETLDLSVLKKVLESREIEISNPYYVEDKSVLKHYVAFAVRDLLDLVYGEAWKNNPDNAIAIVAVDGYKTETSWLILDEEGGYLAYEDLDVKAGWQTLSSHGKEVDPRPFFLLWSGEAQSFDAGFPWMWQVVEMELISAE